MPTPSTIHDGTSERFRTMVRSLSGISLPANKAPMIEQRLRRRVIEHGLTDVNDYLHALVEQQLPETELRHVIDLISTNTTAFFREPEHFDFLRETVVPEIIKRARNKRARLKVWSAASSEGAEAYTTAMVLAEENRLGRDFSWAILGTDISNRMVEKATRAIYDKEQIASVPRDMANRYVMSSRAPAMNGKIRIVPELRDKVKFHHMNLMDKTYRVDRDVDLIFLRNVLIYFDPEDKQAVIERMRDHLRPGGYLLVGHSESMVVRCDGLTQVIPTVFKKD